MHTIRQHELGGPGVPEPRIPLWSGRFGATTIGIFSLAFLIAFESFAVITALPLVVRDLDGLSWYAVSFAAPIAISLISLTFAGAWCDAAGPLRPMVTGVVVFGAGLVVAGLAPTMPLFLVGRAIQGAGSGLATVALYVVIGQTYPEHLRARAFAVVTSAWTLPSLVGPLAAGSIATHLGWRWVFLSVPVIAVLCLMALLPSLRAAGTGSGEAVRADTGAVVVLALGVLAVTVSGQREVSWWPWLLVGAIVLIVLAGRRLLPSGTWSGGRGLPSVLSTGALIGAGYFAAEAYLPLSLVEHQGLGPASAGAVIATAAVPWFLGAWSAANLQVFSHRPWRIGLGTAAVVIATVAAAGSLLDDVPMWVIVIGWAIGGFGMGLASSTLSVLVIDLSGIHEQGGNSAAMQLNDQAAESTVLALGSVVFAGFLATSPMTGYAVVMLGATAIALLAFLPQLRIRPAPAARR